MAQKHQPTYMMMMKMNAVYHFLSFPSLLLKKSNCVRRAKEPRRGCILIVSTRVARAGGTQLASPVCSALANWRHALPPVPALRALQRARQRRQLLPFFLPSFLPTFLLLFFLLFFLSFLGTHPSGRTQLAAAKWFVCFRIVCGFLEEDCVENLRSVLFCLIKKRSV